MTKIRNVIASIVRYKPMPPPHLHDMVILSCVPGGMISRSPLPEKLPTPTLVTWDIAYRNNTATMINKVMLTIDKAKVSFFHLFFVSRSMNDSRTDMISISDKIESIVVKAEGTELISPLEREDVENRVTIFGG